MIVILPVSAFAEGENSNSTTTTENSLQWIDGTGQTIELGDGLAQLKLPKGYSFLDKENTKAYEQQNGSIPTGDELGAIFPYNDNEEENWVVYFDYLEPGHVSDDEKVSIDADDLLQSYKDGTEENNKKQDEKNWLYVDAWDVAPFYDEKLKSLSWSLLLHDAAGNKLLNYNVRILTREGYISAILVSDPEHLAADRKTFVNSVLPALTLKEGKRYEDYVKGTDKASKYGLTALILGGGGLIVAKKVGLIALIVLFAKKFGIIVIAGGAALWRWLRGRSAKKAAVREQAEALDQQYAPVAAASEVIEETAVTKPDLIKHPDNVKK